SACWLAASAGLRRARFPAPIRNLCSPRNATSDDIRTARLSFAAFTPSQVLGTETNQGALSKPRSLCKNEKTLPGLFADGWLCYAIAAQGHSPAKLRLLASKRLGRLVWKWGEAHSNRDGLVFRFPSSTWSRQLRDGALHG